MTDLSSDFWLAMLAGIFAFGTALAFCRVLSRLIHPLRLLDHPNDRSLHARPIPRTGGMAVLAGVLVGVLVNAMVMKDFSSRAGLFLGVGLAPLAVISWLDDYRDIAARWRLLIHLWAAVSLPAAGFAPDSFNLPGLVLPLPSSIAVLLTLLFTVWMINLYNFMDGMDGFAGGMAVIGFTTLAWLGRADAEFTVICLVVAAAGAGFLVYNFPPAKIFLGDTGSTVLGFLAAACSLWGSKMGLFPLWIAWLVFSPFIVDATVTLLRRLLHGEKVWEAHRSHYYQRLVLLGWGHRRTVLAEYALMLACAGSALLAVSLPPTAQAVLALGWALIYSLLMWRVGRLERRRATVLAP
ncbi:MraY family glycosyltransferase [Candidatus Contendibacter odensensis]|nr:glycosyltransferase family 4 protein [Candidatus Contendobacter odensis]MBK8750582.1 glycosyltransferase family 4 protein [Candidatus Competibacteraceae bacterium]